MNLFLIRLIHSARVSSQHCLRGPETAGIVDYRAVGKRDHRVDPGVVIKSRSRLSSRARDRGRFSSFWHRSKSVLRTASSASEIVDSVGWPAPQTAQAGLGDTADVGPDSTRPRLCPLAPARSVKGQEEPFPAQRQSGRKGVACGRSDKCWLLSKTGPCRFASQSFPRRQHRTHVCALRSRCLEVPRRQCRIKTAYLRRI